SRRWGSFFGTAPERETPPMDRGPGAALWFSSPEQPRRVSALLRPRGHLLSDRPGPGTNGAHPELGSGSFDVHAGSGSGRAARRAHGFASALDQGGWGVRRRRPSPPRARMPSTFL